MPKAGTAPGTSRTAATSSRPRWRRRGRSGTRPDRLRGARMGFYGVLWGCRRAAMACENTGVLWGSMGAGGIMRVPAMTYGPAESVFDKRSEEHTSELQSLMRISYAVFCLKKKKKLKQSNLKQ